MLVIFCVLLATACGYLLLVESKQIHHQHYTVEKFIDPHFVNGHEGIVQLFEWKYEDVANECEIFLGPKKFGGVQVRILLNFIAVLLSFHELFFQDLTTK